MRSITTDLRRVNALLSCRAVTVADRGTFERIPSSPNDFSPGRTLENTNSSPSDENDEILRQPVRRSAWIRTALLGNRRFDPSHIFAECSDQQVEGDHLR